MHDSNIVMNDQVWIFVTIEEMEVEVIFLSIISFLVIFG